MRYPAKLQPDEDYFVVTFPDIPEAITQGKGLKESLVNAQDALGLALEFYFDDVRPVPMPSPLKRGQHPIELSISITAKILLLNEMLRQKVKPAKLAKKLHTTPQKINRLVHIRYKSKIDDIAKAMKALGKTLEISIAEQPESKRKTTKT